MLWPRYGGYALQKGFSFSVKSGKEERIHQADYFYK